MRNLLTKILPLAILLFTISCGNSTHEIEPVPEVEKLDEEYQDIETKQATSLEYIKQYKNKYPQAVSLFENSALEARMRDLLGNSDYNLFLKDTSVENPIEIANSQAFMNGARSGGFGTNESALLIDFMNNEITVGILNETKVLFFSENNERTKNDSRNESMDNWLSEAAQNARSN